MTKLEDDINKEVTRCMNRKVKGQDGNGKCGILKWLDETLIEPLLHCHKKRD